MSVLKKVVSLVLALVLMVSLSVPTFASEMTTSEGFAPTATSTWGDLYCYFDPEGFAKLPVAIQIEYNNALLVSETGTNTMNLEMIPLSDSNAETTASAYATLYEDTSAGEISTQDLSIRGLVELLLGVSSTKTTIEYTATLLCTKTCPWMYCSVTVYDADTDKFVDFDSAIESDPTKICVVDGTFDGLKSKHKYKIKAFGNLTPPQGYYLSNPLITEATKETKDQ